MATGIVEATEGLYRALFTAAVSFALGMAVWGLVIAPFNGFNHHQGRSVLIGLVLVAAGAAAVFRRQSLFPALRQRQTAILGVALLGVAVLWLDGGWRSSFYLASYSAIALAAVVAGLRWSLIAAAVLAVGYITGLAVHGYTWERLQDLHDADSVVANTGGYFIAAYFFAAPVAWLGGYVARINQVVAFQPVDVSPETEWTADSAKPRLRTRSLTVREVQVAQLVAGGLSNDEIADQLVLSPRTIQSHVANALKKTGCRNRTELGLLAQAEGLLP